MKELRFSIITVCYNSEATIERTIKSVINQDYPNIEYIIIDGASSDHTVPIIEKYALKIAYWKSEPDSGIYDAMNKGVAIATGDVIGILNSDDCYASNETITEISKVYLNNDIILPVVYGNIRYHHLSGLTEVFKPDLQKEKMLKGPAIFQPAMFVSRKVFSEYGLFSLSYRISSDYDYMFRLFLEGIRFYYIDNIITDMYAGGQSDQHTLKGFWECYLITLKHHIGFFRSSYYFIRHIVLFYTLSVLKR